MKTIQEISSEILSRKQKIEMLESQARGLIEVDDKGRATVLKENKDRAAQLGKALTELRRLNEIDTQRLEKMKEISVKYNIDEDEIHQLNLSIPTLERQITDLESIVEQHRSLYGEIYEKQKNSKNSPFFQREQLLRQTRNALDSQMKARAILETLTRSK